MPRAAESGDRCQGFQNEAPPRRVIRSASDRRKEQLCLAAYCCACAIASSSVIVAPVAIRCVSLSVPMASRSWSSALWVHTGDGLKSSKSPRAVSRASTKPKSRAAPAWSSALSPPSTRGRSNAITARCWSERTAYECELKAIGQYQRFVSVCSRLIVTTQCDEIRRLVGHCVGDICSCSWQSPMSGSP